MPICQKFALLPLRNMAPRGCPQCAGAPGEEPGLPRRPFLWRTIRGALGARGALGRFWKTPAVIYRGHPFGSLSLVTRDIPEEHSSMGAGLAATLAATLAARVVPSAVYGTPRGRLDLYGVGGTPPPPILRAQCGPGSLNLRLRSLNLRLGSLNLRLLRGPILMRKPNARLIF